MANDTHALDERIAEWRNYLSRRQAIEGADIDELEDHLRSQVADLQEAGLDAGAIGETLVRLALRRGDIPAARAAWVELAEEDETARPTRLAEARLDARLAATRVAAERQVGGAR